MPIDPAPVIADALKKRASKPKKQKKSKRKAKKPCMPKLHRPKKESTKTITTRLYKTWAAIVHAYHNDHCAVCGKEHTPQAPLNAHHIMPRQMFSGLRFDPQNGVSLCPRCHKMGKFSAHKGGIWFAEFLRTKFPEKYEHCLKHKDDELDCKDRAKLYSVEDDLHTRYCDAIAPLTTYRVVAYDRKLNKVESVVRAYNNRAAEFLFWNGWPKSEIPLKGIQKTEELKTAHALTDYTRSTMREDSPAVAFVDYFDRTLKNMTVDQLAEKLKGIHKTEELKADHNAIAEHFENLPFTSWITDEDLASMTVDQLAEKLTREFVNQKMTDDMMGRIRVVFDRWCDAHEMDPDDYILYGDKEGNVTICRKPNEDASYLRKIVDSNSKRDIEEMRKDLVSRGLIDEQGRRINTKITPTSMDEMKILVVQEAMK